MYFILDNTVGSEEKSVPHVVMNVDAPFHDDPIPRITDNNSTCTSSSHNGAFMGLWEYEVVEAFFLCSETKQYLEVELGPHGHHLVLLLDGRKNIIKSCLPLRWKVDIGK